MAESTIVRGNTTALRLSTVKVITAIICALLVTAWIGLGFVMLAEPGLDFSTTRVSDRSMFQMTIIPETDPIRINEIHRWKLHVETPEGKIIENATIAVDGDMPEHGHGLPTVPKVTQYLGNGDYLVEGMKFQMTGWWVMDFDVTADGETDHVRFNLQLE